MKVLAEERIVPPQQLDESEAAADAAKANLSAAQKQASAAQSQVSAYGAAVTGATARLESAQAALDNARLQRSYTVITAPTAGVVAVRAAGGVALERCTPVFMYASLS